MMDDGRIKSPYHGFFVSCIFLIAVTSILYLVMYLVINALEDRLSHEMIVYSAMMFGFGLGTIFNLSCVVLGLFRGTFRVVVKRVGNFFSNLSISPKLAFICYKDDLREDGVVFWGYFLIIVFYFVLFMIGLVNCLEYYNSFI